MFSLHWLDLAVLVAYFAAMLLVGVLSARHIKNMDDYYMGGRRFGRTMMVLYAFGAGTHADTAVGVISQSYKLGMAGIWYQWIQIFNTPLLLASQPGVSPSPVPDHSGFLPASIWPIVRAAIWLHGGHDQHRLS